MNWGEMAERDATTSRALCCAAISAFPLPILVCDIDRIRYANAAMASSIEAETIEEVTGRPTDTFLHDSCVEASRIRRSLILETGQRVGPVAVKALTSAHHCHTVTMESWPVPVLDETLIATVVFGSSAPLRPMLAEHDTNPLLVALSEVLLDTLPVPVVIHDSESVVFTNAALNRCMCAQDDQLLGRHFTDFVHDDAREAGEQRRALVFGPRPILRDLQLKLVALDGLPRYAKGTAVTIEVESEPHVMIAFDSIALTPAD
jgi:transcriptional regulator with PAS, ATPase and Fis domain